MAPPALSDVARRLDEIAWDAGTIDDPDLLAFYSERTLRHICALRRWLMDRAPLDRTPDPVDDWIRMVAVNRLTGHSPGFFLGLYAAAQPGGVRAGATQDQRTARTDSPGSRCEEADPA